MSFLFACSSLAGPAAPPAPLTKAAYQRAQHTDPRPTPAVTDGLGVKQKRPYQVRFGERIPVAEGISLSATLVLPLPVEKKRPVILTLTPYGADRYYPLATRYAREGYAAAIVEVRGRGNSDGAFVPYENDIEDGLQVIDWLSRQPFSDGRVGMRGGSYTGFLQWGLAAHGAPALKTIIPGAAPYFGVDSPTYRGVQIPYRLRWYALVAGLQRNGNLNADSAYWQGLYAELARGEISLASLDREAGIDSPYWRKSFTREYVQTLATLLPTPRQLANLSIPVLSVTGIYDGAQLGALTHFRKAAAAAGAAAPLYQVIGPWDHYGVSNPQSALGGISFPEAASTPFEWHLAWFDWVLRSGPKPSFLIDKVSYFSLGDQRWRGRSRLDDSDRMRTLFLKSTQRDASSNKQQRRLADKESLGETSDISQDCWRYDPREEPIRWGPYFGSLAGGENHLINDPLPASLGDRGLVYDSAPLTSPMHIAGNPRLALTLTADVPDTDIAAVLYVVHPNGVTQMLSWDMLRARHRKGMLEAPELLEPGVPGEYNLELTWAAQRIDKGSRLRVLLTSPGISYFFHRNRNSGGDVALETVADSRVATLCLKPGSVENRLELPVDAP